MKFYSYIATAVVALLFISGCDGCSNDDHSERISESSNYFDSSSSDSSVDSTPVPARSPTVVPSVPTPLGGVRGDTLAPSSNIDPNDPAGGQAPDVVPGEVELPAAKSPGVVVNLLYSETPAEAELDRINAGFEKSNQKISSLNQLFNTLLILIQFVDGPNYYLSF